MHQGSRCQTELARRQAEAAAAARCAQAEAERADALAAPLQALEERLRARGIDPDG